MDLSFGVATLHVPGIFSLVLAKGPTMAILADFFIGNTWLSFFSNTIDWDATSLAKALFSFVKISVFALLSSQYLKGSSNNPNWYFANKIRFTAAFNVIIVIFPSSKDFFRVVKNPSETISISNPAFKDNAETCCKSPTPWAIISWTPV